MMQMIGWKNTRLMTRKDKETIKVQQRYKARNLISAQLEVRVIEHLSHPPSLFLLEGLLQVPRILGLQFNSVYKHIGRIFWGFNDSISSLNLINVDYIHLKYHLLDTLAGVATDWLIGFLRPEKIVSFGNSIRRFACSGTFLCRNKIMTTPT